MGSQGFAHRTFDPAALYIHTPFCFHKCHYCDFYSLASDAASDQARHERFIHRLILELQHWRDKAPLQPRTLFVGGGTPTLLRADLWRQLLTALNTLGVLEHVQEFTVEANPETITPELLDLLVPAGVNRMSFGAQSFHPHLLKTLERWHDPQNVRRAVELARAAGLGRVNLDLIFAIPGQTLDMAKADLEHALSLEPDHLSCYSLTYEPNTAMTQRLSRGEVQAVDEDLEARMYEAIIDRLSPAGFEHYEISNWAKPGQRCEHNLIYWRNEDWLAVGPSGSSHIQGLRWKNQPHLGRYLESTGQAPWTDLEELEPDRSLGEQIMLRIRLVEGIELDWLEPRIASDPRRRSEIERCTAAGLLERTATHLRLTRQGLLLADEVAAELL